MTTTNDNRLAFGLQEYPQTVKAVWGARLIFPADLLWDRQDFYGLDTPDGQRLTAWIKKGALRKALTKAAKLADKYAISQDGSTTVVLYEDKTGIIKANPQRSYGYLYVCAYLHGETE
jgi:hypothetical protein